jgi:hypothetical protein
MPARMELWMSGSSSPTGAELEGSPDHLRDRLPRRAQTELTASGRAGQGPIANTGHTEQLGGLPPHGDAAVGDIPPGAPSKVEQRALADADLGGVVGLENFSSTAVGHAQEEVLDTTNDDRPRQLTGALHPRSSETLGSFGVEHEVAHRVCDGNVVPRIDEHAGFAIDDSIDCAPDVPGHDWQAIRTSLEVDDPEALAPHARGRQPARHHEDACSGEPFVTLVVAYESEERHVFLDTKRPRLRLQCPAQMTISHYDPTSLGHSTSDERQRAHSDVETLVAIVEARHRKQRGISSASSVRGWRYAVHAVQNQMNLLPARASHSGEALGVAAHGYDRVGVTHSEARQHGPSPQLIGMEVLDR